MRPVRPSAQPGGGIMALQRDSTHDWCFGAALFGKCHSAELWTKKSLNPLSTRGACSTLTTTLY